MQTITVATRTGRCRSMPNLFHLGRYRSTHYASLTRGCRGIELGNEQEWLPQAAAELFDVIEHEMLGPRTWILDPKDISRAVQSPRPTESDRMQTPGREEVNCSCQPDKAASSPNWVHVTCPSTSVFHGVGKAVFSLGHHSRPLQRCSPTDI